MRKAKGTTVCIDAETYERFKLHSDVTGRSVRDTVLEALNFWMDTYGAAEIEVETGVDVAPIEESPQENTATVENIIPIDTFTEPTTRSLMAARAGHC